MKKVIIRNLKDIERYYATETKTNKRHLWILKERLINAQIILRKLTPKYRHTNDRPPTKEIIIKKGTKKNCDPSYKHLEVKGVKYLLTGIHNNNGVWTYDIKDTNTGVHYLNVSYVKLKDYL
jgi:hypothetical protein